MEVEDKTTAAIVFFIAVAMFIMRKKRKRQYSQRRYWADPFFDPSNRGGVLTETLLSNRFGFKKVLRVTEEDFNILLNLIDPLIRRKNTNMREAVSSEVRLGITLRYLATGDCFESLQFMTRVSYSVISKAVPEVCNALSRVLKDYMKMPQSEREWLEISRRFFRMWQFPHCLGAFDGKHIIFYAPAKSGSKFHNYKGTFSIVLFAIVDAYKRFIFVDVGCQGRVSDGGVLRNTKFAEYLRAGRLHVPKEKLVHGFKDPLPFVFTSDGAFPLGSFIMKPYGALNVGKRDPRRIFDYRLSRARNTVENTFGLLTSIFRLFRRPLTLSVKSCVDVVLGATYLYNFIRRNCADDDLRESGVDSDSDSDYDYDSDSESEYDDDEDIDGEQETGGRRRQGAFGDLPEDRSETEKGVATRNLFCSYFNSPRGKSDVEKNQK